jgi:hypothetical protein
VIKRTFTITIITLLAGVIFVSFHYNEFGFNPMRSAEVKAKSTKAVKVLPEELVGVYKGVRPLYVINESESANLSPGRKKPVKKTELHFIVIETGIIWLAESDSQDSTFRHYEGSYMVTDNSESSVEIKADFRVWNKQGKTYSIRFDRSMGKVFARGEGEPEFELQYIQ